MEEKTPVIAFRSKDYIKTALENASSDQGYKTISTLATRILEEWLKDHGYILMSLPLTKEGNYEESQDGEGGSRFIKISRWTNKKINTD